MKIFVVMYRTIFAFAFGAVGFAGTTSAHHTSLERSIKPTADPSAQPLAIEKEGGRHGLIDA